MNLDIICIAITRFLKCIKENGRLLGLEGKSERINKRNRNGQSSCLSELFTLQKEKKKKTLAGINENKLKIVKWLGNQMDSCDGIQNDSNKQPRTEYCTGSLCGFPQMLPSFTQEAK